jgi:hypothetical protein
MDYWSETSEIRNEGDDSEMKNLILISLVFLCFISANGQKQYKEMYKFGSYTVKTDQSGGSMDISIFKNGKSIYYFSGDGMGFYDVDTLTINSDTLPDFIYNYDMEDYTSVELLVSSTKTPYYKEIDIIYVESPEIYGNITLAKGEEIKPYILMDINKDGRKDLLTNLIKRKDKFFPIKNFSDTLFYRELKDRANGKITKLRSRRVFLDNH